MKIFLTGATGYVGRELALALAKQGDVIHILVRDLSSPNLPQHPNIIPFKGDITNRDTIRPAMIGCEQVYHTAALVKIFDKQRSAFYEINVAGTANVLATALEYGVHKVVFTSSCGVLGNSILIPKTENDVRTTRFNNEYEFTKSLAEDLVNSYHEKGLATVIVSLSKVFGPGVDTHPITVNRVIKRFIQGRATFIPYPGTYTSNYCFIPDVVAGHLLAMSQGRSGEKYILGGENITYVELFKRIRRMTGTKALLIETPKILVQIWALLQWINFKLTGKEPAATLPGIKHIFCNKLFSSEKAIHELGYQVTPLNMALQDTINYLEETVAESGKLLSYSR